MDAAYLLSTSAMRCVPVAVVDVVAAVYLLRVWQRAPMARRADLAALPLGLYFAALAALAFAQLMMCSAVELRTSFLWNHMGQSVSAALSVPPLVAFSVRYLEPNRGRFERVLTGAALVCSVAISAAFIVDALTTDAIWYDFEYTHGRKLSDAETPWQALITGYVFLGYSVSLGFLCRRAWRAPVGQRFRVWRFAAVVLAAVGAVAVNRLETVGAVPAGVYATYVVWVTLAAIVMFMGSTDEITSFRERTVSLVLVAGLALLATVSQRAVDNVRDDARSMRRALAVAVLAGTPVGGGEVTSGAERVEGVDVRRARVIEVVEGGAVSFPYVVEREAVHAAALPLAILILLSVLGVLVLIPLLAQWSVLGPLAALTRAEEQSRAKSMFLAQMSHELKTPLHAILFHTRALLADDAVATDERQRRARTVERSAEHLRALIDNLLASGRGALQVLKPRPRPVVLKELVERIADGHRPTAEAKQLRLVVRMGDGVPERAVFDDNLLRQVLDNLLGNATKYSDQGTVQLGLDVRADLLVWSVKDEGRGIPLALQERVFQPFFQHEPREGVGLGLAIVREITTALGGALRLSSSPGKGTEVHVTIPFVAPTTEQAARTPLPAELVHPPAHETAELLALARVGDVVALGDKARALRDAAAAEHKPFYQRIMELAASYQVRAVRRLLDDESKPDEAKPDEAKADDAAPDMPADPRPARRADEVSS